MHSIQAIKWLNKEMRSRGIGEYRFCIENDNYICDKFGNSSQFVLIIIEMENVINNIEFCLYTVQSKMAMQPIEFQ